jgi:hypothetical protein
LAPATRDQLRCGLLFWLACLAAWLIFVPALHGTFIFDDFPNLEGLQRVSSDRGVYGSLKYILSGASGPLGRPLALATFAFQHASWPLHPEDFIRVNALLHLLNGCLLWWWLLRWQRLAARPGARAPLFLTLAISVLWLLAPMQANAAFYVVQRMAVLSSTFVLAGLLLHTVGRDAGHRGQMLRAHLLMTAGMAVGLGLGILAKESAALYPVLVLTYEATLLRAVARPPRWAEWSLAFLKLPTLLILAYLCWIGFTLDSPGLPRPASWERLVVESRLLFLYLYKLFVPSLYGTRLMYDDYSVVLMNSPWLTPFAAVAWLALIALALRQRTAWPLFSFGVLWFLAAHLLESTVVPLELAFEHRNYLAIVGPLAFLVMGVAWLVAQPWVGRARTAVVAVAAAYGLFTALGMWQTAILWGSPTELALFWSDRQPESRRALQHAANSLFLIGATEQGREKFEQGAARWPRDPVIPLGLLQTACALPKLPLPDLGDIERRLRASDGHALTALHMLDGLLRQAEAGSCSRLSPPALRGLTTAVLESRAFAGLERFSLMLNSRSAELAGDRPTAMHCLDRAIALSPRIPLLKQAILWSLQADNVPQARAYLQIAETAGGITRVERWSQRDEIRGMRQLIDLYTEITTAPAAE